MAAVVEQPAEGVLHGAGHGREDVGLEGGHVDDVCAEERLGHLDTIGEDLIEDEHLAFGGVRHPARAAILEVETVKAVAAQDAVVFIALFSFVGINNDGAVLDGLEAIVAGASEGLDHAVELPGTRAAARVVVLPADVDLEKRFAGYRQVVAEVCEFHETCDVGQDCRCARIKDRDERFTRGRHGRRCGRRRGDSFEGHGSIVGPRMTGVDIGHFSHTKGNPL
ncbi:hypothetical protein J0H33_16325 [bacterium]|nr:hypothetical protein [bacterium]